MPIDDDDNDDDDDDGPPSRTTANIVALTTIGFSYLIKCFV